MLLLILLLLVLLLHIPSVTAASSAAYAGTAGTIRARVAGLGRLSAGAKMAMKPFVKRLFTIFATNASFLRVISNF